jgi:kinetochore protein Spc7/SPC105
VPEELQVEGEGASGDQENFDDPDWEPIQLQDFLNLTNIHFMELTTTKRRHTTVPGSDRSMDLTGSRDSEKRNITFEDCVAAGFCTVPMLELYQHVSISLRKLLQPLFTNGVLFN